MRFVSLLALVLVASEARAEGLSWNIGLGVGASSMSDAMLGASAGALSGRLSYELDPSLLVGAEIFLLGQYNAWKEEQAIYAGLSSIMAVATWRTEWPAYAIGGVGWGSAFTTRRTKNVVTTNDESVAFVKADSGHGISWVAGAGWAFSLQPFLGLELRYDGAALAGLDSIHSGTLSVRAGF